ncbi:vesicle-associated membrane protein 2, partial [Tupaia chinensis]|uniref:vesicle-associated membrane protein 2 n=1 Tax=Tupaia chinensis TaxID=246437 RepID=UPI0007040462
RVPCGGPGSGRGEVEGLTDGQVDGRSPGCGDGGSRPWVLIRPLLRSATAATAPPAAPAGEGGPPAPPPNLTSNRRLQQTQAQVDEVVDIMRVNVDKVLERDQKLSELDDRADALQAGASQFETSAAKLKRKYWWKNLKMMIILGVICAIILIIIIGEWPGPFLWRGSPCRFWVSKVINLVFPHQQKVYIAASDGFDTSRRQSLDVE